MTQEIKALEYPHLYIPFSEEIWGGGGGIKQTDLNSKKQL